MLFGLMALVGVSIILPESGWLPRLGLLFWYVTMGGFIGITGVLDLHPVLNIQLPWWIRGPFVGAWMNFVLVFFAYDLMIEVIRGASGHLLSPFWFVLEGGVIGAIIG